MKYSHEVTGAGAVNAMLERLRTMGGDLHDPLEAIGRAWKKRVQDGFIGSVDPWGRPWAELKWRHGQPLRDTNKFMNSIDYLVDGDTLEVGTNHGPLDSGGSIAAVHQFGTKRAGRDRKTVIPARRFLPIGAGADLPQEWADDAIGAFLDEIREAAAATTA